MSESSNDSTMVDCVVQQAERLLAALSSLCTKENTDVCIECDEQKFFCHGVILKARSMYFYQMVESGSQVIKVEGVRPEIMNEIINYIYTSQVRICLPILFILNSLLSRSKLPQRRLSK